METSGTTGYAWDFENRLTSVTPPNSGGTVSFKYDPFGRRIQKVSSSGTTNYVYDSANIVAEYDGSGALIARYAQGQGIDQPLAITKQGTTAYYNGDGLGSITTLRDAGGALVASYSYEAFGKTTSTGTLVNPFQYTGREWDQETGLYYYRARYYEPINGRFLSEDPLGDIAGPNRFKFVENNPVVLVDPSGLAPTSWHYQSTLDLAKAILGPHCAYSAKLLAEADKRVDENHGLKGKAQFLAGMGPAWQAPGPHFPDATMLENLRNDAFNSGNIEALGSYLHSLQDAITHDTISPFDHWTHFWAPDKEAINDLNTQDRALQLTAAEITAFRDKWMRYCTCELK